jgi:hypothetical protein
MPPLTNSPYRLLVEGTDDQHSVIHLMARHGYDWDDSLALRPYVHVTGNLNQLMSELPVTLKDDRHFQRIGISVDTEEPGLPFGTALRAQVFRHNSEDALRFVSWFKRLFVDA